MSVHQAVLLVAACSSSCATTSATARPVADGGISSCAVPAGADPRVRAATAFGGWHCTRLSVPLRAPRDVIESDGALYVSEMAAGRVSRIDGLALTTVVEGLNGPIGLRAAAGALVLGEEGAQRVSRIENGTLTPLATGLGNVTYVAAGADGAIYASAFSDLAATSGVIHHLGGPDLVTGLVVPEGLAFDAAGNLLVVEWGGASHASRIVNGVVTSIATGFVHLYGIAVAGSDIYLADVGGDRIVVVHADGTQEDVLRDVAAPAGISFASNGDLLVAEHVDGDKHDATGYVIRLSR